MPPTRPSPPDPLDLIDRGREGRRQDFPDLGLDEATHLAHLATLSQLVEAYFQRRLRPHGLSPSDYRVLTALRLRLLGERATPQELNHFTRITSAGMTRTLDRLEAAGYLARVPNPDDRRSVLVELTDVGVEFADTMIRDLQTHYADILDGLAASENKAETETLRRIIARLAAAMGGTG